MSERMLVSEKLVCDVIWLLFYLERDLNYGDLDIVKRLCTDIEAEISDKFERMKRRKVFTAYKTVAPGPERESLRKDYIELAQFRKSFTSNHEIPYHLLK